MFKTETVFLLGAGASAPYGFSTGKKLLKKVSHTDGPALADLAFSNEDRASFDRLAEALRPEATYSIDQLLERRRDLLIAGKKTIAQLLLNEELSSTSAAVEEDGDWIRWVFNQMIDNEEDPKRFASNPVSFVTYNYDRLLEHRFRQGLRAVYRLTDEQAAAIVSGVQIIHLHGQIGPLYIADAPNPRDAISFGATRERDAMSDAVATAANYIKIIHEGQVDSEEYQRARRCISGAKQIIVLGFGFARTNTERLAMTNIDFGGPVYCSTVGIRDAEYSRNVVTAFHQNTRSRIEPSREPLERFLRDHAGLVD